MTKQEPPLTRREFTEALQSMHDSLYSSLINSLSEVIGEIVGDALRLIK